MESEVDVVIPTFKRPEALANCLEALSEQTLAPASIEVVDDSDTDYGPGISRNIGWKKGRGRYVAFIDDDCIADPSWIETIQRVLSENEIGGVEGGITTTDKDGQIIDFNPPNRFKWDRFKTANMAVKRDVLVEIGGFDERYFLHREDTDLAWRVIDAGYKMAWVPECVVHHPEPIGIHGAVYGAYPRSEQLLYHCNPRKFVESAASLISFKSIGDGKLWKLQRDLRRVHDPPDVRPLSRVQSWALWTRAWCLSIFWMVRKFTMGEPRRARHRIE
jgi:glycosyltransferase involved in cell wall biosynthesis